MSLKHRLQLGTQMFRSNDDERPTVCATDLAAIIPKRAGEGARPVSKQLGPNQRFWQLVAHEPNKLLTGARAEDVNGARDGLEFTARTAQADVVRTGGEFSDGFRRRIRRGHGSPQMTRCTEWDGHLKDTVCQYELCKSVYPLLYCQVLLGIIYVGNSVDAFRVSIDSTTYGSLCIRHPLCIKCRHMAVCWESPEFEWAGEVERRIYRALEGLEIGEGPNHWIACVAGVHVDGNDAWVQVTKDGDDATAFVVRVPADATETDLQLTLAGLTASVEPNRVQPTRA